MLNMANSLPIFCHAHFFPLVSTPPPFPRALPLPQHRLPSWSSSVASLRFVIRPVRFSEILQQEESLVRVVKPWFHMNSIFWANGSIIFPKSSCSICHAYSSLLLSTSFSAIAWSFWQQVQMAGDSLRQRRVPSPPSWASPCMYLFWWDMCAGYP